MSLSVLILTKNAEDVIKGCIESITSIADEIIVVDSLSSDKTCDIAKKLKAQVFRNPFIDFATQRNIAFSKAKGDFILYLDSDEQATPEFRQEVQDLISRYNKNSSVGGYYIYRKTFFLGREWNFVDKMQRLFLKSKFIQWKGAVHETAEIEGTYSEIKSPVLHYTHRNLHLMLEKTNEWSNFEAELRFKANHPPMSEWRFLRVMTTAFFQSYFKEKGYKNGTEGIIESLYQAFSLFITYAKLWELQNRRRI